MSVDSKQPMSIAGYSLVLPPGWVRIPLRNGSEDAVRRAAKQVFQGAHEDIPRDEMGKYRLKIEGKLREVAAQAARSGGVDLYLPTSLRGGVATPCSIVVSEMRLPGGESVEAGDMLRRLTEDADFRAADVDGSAGARSERLRTTTLEQGAKETARHVDYVLLVPGNSGRWLSIAFSTPGDGDPDGEFALLLVELFDAIMATFSWQHHTV
ncbi:hypothetical protein AB0M87_04065 [Streptomyces sp. NPDC051320]|uniref:hypothetical protein n=1 Tax=Streptomyces sp. NPDC051320 TaxID=3154644 RepID=UPI0034348120